MRKDGYAEESLIAHEVHKYVAGHDVGEEGTDSLRLLTPLVLEEVEIFEHLLWLRAQPPQ